MLQQDHHLRDHMSHNTDSIPVGTSVSPMLADNIDPTAFWPAEATLAQCRQATCKNCTQRIASANRITAWCYVAIV